MIAKMFVSTISETYSIARRSQNAVGNFEIESVELLQQNVLCEKLFKNFMNVYS